MRKVTVDCGLCGERISLERAKEILFETGNNAYHAADACPACLDRQLQRAESVNDTNGYRQTAAVLLRLPGYEVPSSIRA